MAEALAVSGEPTAAAKSAGERKAMDDYRSSHNIYRQGPTTWSCVELAFLVGAWLLVILLPCFWCYLWRTVRDYERALIFRLGKLKGAAVGPGVFVINPLTDNIFVVDLRIETFNLPPQDMMTKDAVTVKVDAIVFMKVNDPISCILEVDDYRKAFQFFAATTLRSVIGQYELESLLCERDILNDQIRQIVEKETGRWGVHVPAVEIKDVKLPQNMQRAMAAEAEAERERRAKVISATGEAQAAGKLAEAATSISEAPGALQLRYLHTLVKISAEKNSTILFPLPMEIMRGIQRLNAGK